MSIRVMTAVWDRSKTKGSDLLVLLALADFAHDNGFAFPSVNTLARKARISERQAQRAVQNLIRGGELEVRHESGPHGTNLYRVLVPEGDSLTPGGDNGGFAGVTPASPEPSVEPSGVVGEDPSSAGDVVEHITKAQRDNVWSALAGATETYPETISERSLFGKCVKELAQAGATPEEITVRAERYVKKYPGAALTPKALVNHWGDLARPVSGRRGRLTADDIRRMGREG